MGCCGGGAGKSNTVWRHVRPDGTVQDYTADQHREAKAAYDKLGGSLQAVPK